MTDNTAASIEGLGKYRDHVLTEAFDASTIHVNYRHHRNPEQSLTYWPGQPIQTEASLLNRVGAKRAIDELAALISNFVKNN